MSQLLAIYIFCENELNYIEWSLNYMKIHGIFTDQDVLQEKLSNDLKLFLNDLTMSMSTFHFNENSIRDLNNENGSFFWCQLLIMTLLDMEQTMDAKEELLNVCRLYYENNHIELLKINEFDKNYSSDKAIYWYTRDSFLYRLLNKALRTQNIDIIFKFRFFIIDLQKQLTKMHQIYMKSLQSYNTEQLIVYRGQRMLINDFKKLQLNIGGLISMNTFLSTTIDKDVAIIYAGDSSESSLLESILFIININIKKVTKTKSFVNIENESYFKSEGEVLFSMGAIFRINSIEKLNHIWQVKLILVNEDNQHLQDLHKHLTIKSGEKSTRADLGYLLLYMGDDERAIEFCKLTLLNESDLDLKATCYSIIGQAYLSKGEYQSALENFQQTLNIRLKSQPMNFHSLSIIYNNIGLTYRRMKSPNSKELAMEYYQKALDSQSKHSQSFTIDHNLLATIKHNITSLKYPTDPDNAINELKEVLKIRLKLLPYAHPFIAQTYASLGHVYSYQEKYQLALENFNKQLDISIKYSPKEFHTISTIYNRLFQISICIGDQERILAMIDRAENTYQMALKYAEQALQSTIHSSTSNYNNILDVYINMGVVYIRLMNDEQAIKYLEKAREIKEKHAPSNSYIHGIWFNNMGKVYAIKMNFEIALNYYQEAINFYLNNVPSYHSFIARTYYNIGQLYQTQKQYELALENYQKALEINLKELSSKHSSSLEYQQGINHVKKYIHTSVVPQNKSNLFKFFISKLNFRKS